ncbi:MAG: hypothetical protein IPJ26_12550 [Bacteroidetes bacterium]|nr:hypothetical protein [Bacteroidota bacterium]
MLDLIITLLLALGINTSDSEGGAIVIDQQSGMVFGVGTTSGFGNSTSNPSETPVYMLVQDDNGEYRLVRR